MDDPARRDRAERGARDEPGPARPDPAAPPLPGTATPVPVDAAARAAAAGRAHAVRAESAPARDALVPTTALQTRAAERERRRRERERAAMPAYAPPPMHEPPHSAAPPVAPSFPPQSVGTLLSGGPAAAEFRHSAPAAAALPGYAPAPGYGPPAGYAVPMHPAAPYASATPYPYAAYPPPPPPRLPWTRRQTRAAVLSSWLGQTVMALATHFLVTYFSIVGFAWLLHATGEPIGTIEADSLTSTVALWTMPDRVVATAIIGAIVGGGLLALGAILSRQWGRAAGLAKPHRSAWLAWLCTTGVTGLFGFAYWPGAIVVAFVATVASSSASLTLGSMWATLFGLLAMAVVLTGGVGLLFGWLFLSTSRPRVDPRAIAAAQEAAAEAAARARDEAELTQVRPRGARP
ncbi:hypothetical protein [Agrococcus lahaulensis]|uniref:hypothetical protein n=1 Tax=Agrococcus lahaulensis TaxID=341722 RepID=UPI0004257C59|nr:hypothetical protein [Agrococcus lahaulensis]